MFEGAADLFDLLPDANELLAVAVHVRDHLIEVDAKLLHPEQAQFELLFLLLDVLDLHGRSVNAAAMVEPAPALPLPMVVTGMVFAGGERILSPVSNRDSSFG